MSCNLKKPSKHLEERSKYDQHMNHIYSSFENPRSDYDISIQKHWESLDTENYIPWIPEPRTAYDRNENIAWGLFKNGCNGVTGPPCSSGEGGFSGPPENFSNNSSFDIEMNKYNIQNGYRGNPIDGRVITIRPNEDELKFKPSHQQQHQYRTVHDNNIKKHHQENFQSYAMQDPDSLFSYRH